MVLAPIVPAREAELRALLASMNGAPGQADPENELIPFGALETLHFARFIILDDKTTGDVGVYGLETRSYPLYLAFLGDVDGEEAAFLRKLAKRAATGLRRIFSCCEGFDGGTDLLAWMTARRNPPAANYVNARGRTVVQVRDEAALRDALEAHMTEHAAAFASLSPEQIHTALKSYIEGEIESGRLRLSPPSKTPFGWRVRNTLHFAGMPLLVLLALPLILVALPFYLFLLRRREKTDPVVAPAVDQAYSDNMSSFEDHGATNAFSAMGSLKPGRFRLMTIKGVLSTIDYAARHLTWAGRLGRIRTIHFARWVFVAGRERILFCSNYDGSVDSYMDDFINKTGFGLNMSFSNGIGYPATNWLIKDGCKDERKYKEYLRRHTMPTQVWYKAYPGLTAIDLDRNTRIRQGLEAAALNEEEGRAWVALL
jgi:hypothetical protein